MRSFDGAAMPLAQDNDIVEILRFRYATLRMTSTSFPLGDKCRLRKTFFVFLRKLYFTFAKKYHIILARTNTILFFWGKNMEKSENLGLDEQEYKQLKEKTVHGTALLPFAKYHTNISEMLPFYPIHWHEEMEVIKVQSGVSNFCVEGVWYTACAGDILILRPFAMHSINRFENQDASMDAIVFNLRLLGSDEADDLCTLKYFAPLLNERHSMPCIVRTTDSWYHSFDESLTSLLTVDEKAEGAELDIKANLYWMFYHIYANRLINVKTNVSEDKRNYMVRKVLEFIRTEYMNEITIEKIAKQCGYSEFYTMKLFRQFTGCSCLDYVNNYRLTVAGRKLRDTDAEVSAIAYQVGFNNVSYFNRQFKKQYGMTPKEFRNARWGK